jgi:hypothetical protein
LRMALAAVSLVCLLSCAAVSPPSTPKTTVATARKNYGAALNNCQLARSSRLSTLGPPIFQPISGDEVFNDCVTRARNDLELALSRRE